MFPMTSFGSDKAKARKRFWSIDAHSFTASLYDIPALKLSDRTRIYTNFDLQKQ